MCLEKLSDGRFKLGDFVMSDKELEDLLSFYMADTEPFITTNDVCDMFKLSRSTVYKMMNEKKLPYYKFGECIRFKKSELLAVAVKAPVEA